MLRKSGVNPPIVPLPWGREEGFDPGLAGILECAEPTCSDDVTMSTSLCHCKEHPLHDLVDIVVRECGGDARRTLERSYRPSQNRIASRRTTLRSATFSTDALGVFGRYPSPPSQPSCRCGRVALDGSRPRPLDGPPRRRGTAYTPGKIDRGCIPSGVRCSSKFPSFPSRCPPTGPLECARAIPGGGGGGMSGRDRRPRRWSPENGGASPFFETRTVWHDEPRVGSRPGVRGLPTGGGR